MELFVISMAVVGLCTTIAAIDETIDWMGSYRRVGEEDSQRHNNDTSNYDIGYHE